MSRKRDPKGRLGAAAFKRSVPPPAWRRSGQPRRQRRRSGKMPPLAPDVGRLRIHGGDCGWRFRRGLQPGCHNHGGRVLAAEGARKSNDTLGSSDGGALVDAPGLVEAQTNRLAVSRSKSNNNIRPNICLSYYICRISFIPWRSWSDNRLLIAIVAWLEI